MAHTNQVSLFSELNPRPDLLDWTFNGASTRELTHCYHDYPARMIPQVAGNLLDMFGINAKLLFDPYCGTGTSLVEGLIRGINAVGTDLNPLARLIAQAKTCTPDEREIDDQITRFDRCIASSHVSRSVKPSLIPGISRIDFWFKPQVAEKLSRLKMFIDDIENDAVRLFFQVAFSETVRESSNTRNNEFKLYRYDSKRLHTFNPNVFEIMSSKLKRNRAGLHKFLAIMHNFRESPAVQVCDFNSVVGTPSGTLLPASVDIVVTSPPYGDSHTTVAYGQYSRLSAAWLGLPEPGKIDNKLMGGKAIKSLPNLPSDALNKALIQISSADIKRALEVASFYSDLHDSIFHVSQLIRLGGHACYVVGNRKVKGVVLPTDIAIRDFFEGFGFEHISTFHRSIPNKRMPLRNSPTNAPGAVDATMTREYIVVVRRKNTKAVHDRKLGANGHAFKSPANGKRRSRVKAISQTTRRKAKTRRISDIR